MKPHNRSNKEYWSKYWWKHTPIYRFVDLIRSELPVDSFVSALTKEMGKFRTSQEPVAAIIRDSLGIKKNGRQANILKWVQTMPRVEYVVAYINQHGNSFAKVVANESIAHRYADYLFQTCDLEYETKMKIHYMTAYKISLKKGYLKNIDSSIYWLATAYCRALDIEGLKECHDRFHKEAKSYFCKVAKRSGKRFKAGPAFGKKIILAKKRCKTM